MTVSLDSHNCSEVSYIIDARSESVPQAWVLDSLPNRMVLAGTPQLSSPSTRYIAQPFLVYRWGHMNSTSNCLVLKISPAWYLMTSGRASNSCSMQQAGHPALQAQHQDAHILQFLAGSIADLFAFTLQSEGPNHRACDVSDRVNSKGEQRLQSLQQTLCVAPPVISRSHPCPMLQRFNGPSRSAHRGLGMKLAVGQRDGYEVVGAGCAQQQQFWKAVFPSRRADQVEGWPNTAAAGLEVHPSCSLGRPARGPRASRAQQQQIWRSVRPSHRAGRPAGRPAGLEFRPSKSSGSSSDRSGSPSGGWGGGRGCRGGG
jgi:hypothetical protein